VAWLFTHGVELRKFGPAVIRRLVAGLIVVGLAVGIWALWPRGEDSGTTTTTLPVAVESTTTATTTPVTTTVPETTSTSDAAQVVTTVEEAEAILRELWFGWFEGIYNQDEERIRQVVGTQAYLEAARQAFGQMAFAQAPTADALLFDGLEILRSDQDCLALWVSGSAPFVELAPVSTTVDVLRWHGDRWVLVSSWQNKEDLWEADCDAQLEPLS
jgi:hypothetical protein